MLARNLIRSFLFVAGLLVTSEGTSAGLEEMIIIKTKEEFERAIKEAKGGKNVLATHLKLRNCGMKEVSEEIQKFTKLQKMILGENELTTLPEQIGELPELYFLDLQSNSITRLPPSMEKLNLSLLDLSENPLETVPPVVWKLAKLTHLHLMSLLLDKFSVSSEGPIMLMYLLLSHNRIGALSGGDINKMPNLEYLALNDNSLLEIPEEIGGLKHLQELHLDNNLIGFLPHSILNLKSSLTKLNLESNPLKKLGEEGKTLGWWNLHENFEAQVKFSDNIIDQLSEDPRVEKLFTELDAKDLRWNREELKNIATAPLPSHGLDRNGILELWGRVKGWAIRRKLEGYATVEKYIKEELYPEDQENAFLRNGPERQNYMMDLMEEILKKILERMESAEGSEPLAALNAMGEGRKSSIDEKLRLLQKIYAELHGRSTLAGNFKDFIRGEVAVLKDSAINQMFCPEGIEENVCILNEWRYRLREDLGTGMNYDLGANVALDKDPFHGIRFNALKKFYSSFTPKYVIEKLQRVINGPQNEKRRVEAYTYLLETLFEVNEEAPRSIRLNPIKSEEVEHFLVKMGILKKGFEDETRR